MPSLRAGTCARFKLRNECISGIPQDILGIPGDVMYGRSKGNISVMIFTCCTYTRPLLPLPKRGARHGHVHACKHRDLSMQELQQQLGHMRVPEHLISQCASKRDLEALLHRVQMERAREDSEGEAHRQYMSRVNQYDTGQGVRSAYSSNRSGYSSAGSRFA